ncbi:MAG TPA: fibronectin type III domain-containing protein [Candidatus Angelobacter sp.]|nr:fibronectin type III domain-containing protein [Candidatus Angelobacter sp.]
MMKVLKIAAFMLLCVCFVAMQTPATAQTPTAAQQAGTQVEKPMLEFANATSAKIAWTSKASQDLVLQYGTDPNNFGPLAADAIEHSGGDNHRATISNLQPSTTYYVRMVDKSGQPVGPVFTFQTPAQGGKPIHEQPLQAK